MAEGSAGLFDSGINKDGKQKKNFLPKEKRESWL